MRVFEIWKIKWTKINILIKCISHSFMLDPYTSQFLSSSTADLD